MVKVKLLKGYGKWKEGETIEVTEKVSGELVAAKYAELVKPGRPKEKE